MSDDPNQAYHGQVPNGPSQAQQEAHDFIRSTKAQFVHGILAMPSIEIPAEHMVEYNALLEKASHFMMAADHSLFLVQIVFSGTALHQQFILLIQNICLVGWQRHALASSSISRYILTLDHLKRIMAESERIMEIFWAQFNAARERRAQMEQQMAQNYMGQ